jgi:hypothetical protein
MFSILLILLVANLYSAENQTAAKIVTCEKVEDLCCDSFGFFKTCFMNDKTTINGDGFNISPNDETIERLIMTNNQEIEFLPENVNETFPDLFLYAAISNKNFKGLSKLRELNLAHNQIETIPSDTFKDLTWLQELDLCKNIFGFF